MFDFLVLLAFGVWLIVINARVDGHHERLRRLEKKQFDIG